MNNFGLMRYLKKYLPMILVFTAAATLIAFLYAWSRQSYTASAIIQYTNEEILLGKTPNGKDLDVLEIDSANVVAAAMNRLGLNTSVDSVRSQCAVEPVLTEDQETLNQALLQRGEEVTFFPDTYQISVTADYTKSADYARDLLDSIIQSYFSYYSDQYVRVDAIPNGAEAMDMESYDYLSNISILETSVSEMINYLETILKTHPDFRATATGYTYNDILELYNYSQDYVITDLYRLLLSVEDPSIVAGIVEKLNDQVWEYENQMVISTNSIELYRSLMKQYAGHSSQMLEATKGENGESGGARLSEFDPNEDDRYVPQTYYDTLIMRKIDHEQKYEKYLIMRDHALDMIQVLSDAPASAQPAAPEAPVTSEDPAVPETSAAPEGPDAPEESAAPEIPTAPGAHAVSEPGKSRRVLSYMLEATDFPKQEDAAAELSAAIQKCYDQLTEYYSIAMANGKELSARLATDYICLRNSITVRATINILVYTIIGLALGLALGCLAAVALGRTGDFVSYFLYTDQKLNVPNRASCDRYVQEFSKQLLPEQFTCIYVVFTALQPLTQQFGYVAGDEVMRDFAQILNSVGKAYGFVAYNGSGQFVCFFEQCSPRKAELILRVLSQEVEKYNAASPEKAITYDAAFAESASEDIYEIRHLMKKAIQDCMAVREGAR